MQRLERVSNTFCSLRKWEKPGIFDPRWSAWIIKVESLPAVYNTEGWQLGGAGVPEACFLHPLTWS